MARIKDDRYYSEYGARRPISRYVYLGSNDAIAMTWIDNGIKYAKVFKNDMAYHKWKKESEYKGPCKIERKHISRHGAEVVDIDTGMPVRDFYLEDNKYLLNRAVDSNAMIDREIRKLERSIIGVTLPPMVKEVTDKINELKQKKFESQKTVVTIDETDIDAVDAKIAELDRNDPSNPYLAKLVGISNRYWDE